MSPDLAGKMKKGRKNVNLPVFVFLSTYKRIKEKEKKLKKSFFFFLSFYKRASL